MRLKKLNFGCGDRYADGWVNIDVNSGDPRVKSVNFIEGFPYADGTFDVVYSSHVMEHFSREKGMQIIQDAFRILKKGGILRIVVPDFEQSCREYIDILDHAEDDSEMWRMKHEWIFIELLDQLVRTKAAGEYPEIMRRAQNASDTKIMEYIVSRTQNLALEYKTRTLAEKIKDLSVRKIRRKIIGLYISLVKRLLPSSLRAQIIDDTPIGEKHKWMYDRKSLGRMLECCGFKNIKFMTARDSQIEGFSEDRLDILPDGKSYKNVSIYCEAMK